MDVVWQVTFCVCVSLNTCTQVMYAENLQVRQGGKGTPPLVPSRSLSARSDSTSSILQPRSGKQHSAYGSVNVLSHSVVYMLILFVAIAWQFLSVVNFNEQNAMRNSSRLTSVAVCHRGHDQPGSAEHQHGAQREHA